MINHSSSINTLATSAVQADVKNSQQAEISTVATTEIAQSDKVITQLAGIEKPVERKTKAQEQSAELAPEVAPDKVEEAVASLNAFVQLMDRNVSFEVDELSGRGVISVFERETKELIRQIPSEETLALLERMDKMVGVLFNEEV